VITSTVSQGVVTLEGIADCWSQREDARSSAASGAEPSRISPGGSLRRLRHRRSSSSAAPTPQVLALNRAAAAKMWAPNRVAVVPGTPGVRGVDDQLRIEPFAI
jgi:hypothetical protein